MKCKNCKNNRAYIQQGDDSYYKEVFCPDCTHKTPLKYYNKKTIC